MAQDNQHPTLRAIAEGRLVPCPNPYHGLPTVVTVDLDHLAARMKEVLNEIIPFIDTVRTRVHAPTEASKLVACRALVDNMVDAAIAICYNRLRNVAERHAPTTRRERMNTRAPINGRLEFPTYISSTLSNIGPLRIKDGPLDMLVIYATTAARANTFGRAVATVFNTGQYNQLMEGLRAANVPLSVIDTNNVDTGSFFTTVVPREINHIWDFTGTCHTSHYETNDVIRSFLTCSLDVNRRAFPYVGMIIGECNIEAVTQAIAAARPQGVAETLTCENAEESPIGHMFFTNIFGIRRGTPAAEGRAAVPATAWIVGRGSIPFYQESLARDHTVEELIHYVRYSLFH